VRRERGLVLIITYKLVKGGLWLVIGIAVLVAMHLHFAEWLLDSADHLRHHSRAWSIELAELLVTAASKRGLWTLVVALFADGLFSLLEGWALLHGHWWGPWLVVVGTGSLLPFEVVALARHFHPSRVLLLVTNLAIVWYLARKALRERRERLHPPSQSGVPGR
jgi:uncharacterized membrane protein (DUF2068 family)